jgi:hypothetical protein
VSILAALINADSSSRVSMPLRVLTGPPLVAT